MWSGSIANSQGIESHLLTQFITKTIPFKFRGIDLTFALSQGLFSSADVDSGTKLLLKVLSNVLDADSAEGKAPPARVLDSGCGTGVIGICAAAAIGKLGGAARVRCQDRDELARLISAHNAAANKIPPEALSAFTEPLLAGPPDARWDLILTNIPAKAGQPVLEDFVRRSTALLAENGRVIMVAVQALADFFQQAIDAAGARILREETGPEHRVFVYGRKTGPDPYAPVYEPVSAGTGFLARYPFYRRAVVDFEADELPLRIETVYGAAWSAAGFEGQSAAERAVMALIEKIGRRLNLERLWPETDTPGSLSAAQPVLIHEPGQGFFPCRLLAFLRRLLPPGAPAHKPPRMAFSGRNILTLEAARHNYERLAASPCAIVPVADLTTGAEAVHAAAAQSAVCAKGQYGLLIAFPELLPQSALPKTQPLGVSGVMPKGTPLGVSKDTLSGAFPGVSLGSDQLSCLWESISPLLCPGGVFVAGLSSTEAERFDRKKPAGFTRMGDIKRGGFRSLGFRMC